MNKKRIVILILTSLAVFLGALLLGSTHLNIFSFFSSDEVTLRILGLRFSRVLVAAFIGGGLAAVGATYQTLFLNPLAEPYVLGVSSSSLLGVAIGEFALHLPTGSPAVVALALLGGLCTAFVLERSSARMVRFDPSRIVLFGMGINFVFSSIVFLVVSYVYQGVGGGNLRWLFGYVPWVSLSEVIWVGAAAFIVLIILVFFARHLDALALGDSVARTLGVNPARTRLLLILATSGFISATVSLSGSIGFIGLVVPHAVRLVFHPRNTREALALTAVVGAVFLVFSDALSRSIAPPLEFPVGILTTLIGGPVFLWILWRRLA